jgi:hypothetical protein
MAEREEERKGRAEERAERAIQTRQQAAETEARRAQARTDPRSPESIAAQHAVKTSRDAMYETPPAHLTDERVEQMSYETIEGTPIVREMLRAQQNIQLFHARGRRARGGGGGVGARELAARGAIVDSMVNRWQDQNPDATPEQLTAYQAHIENIVPHRAREIRSLQTSLVREGAVMAPREERRAERRAEREEAGARIVGWERQEGAPELTAPELRDLRKQNEQINLMNTHTAAMLRLVREADALEKAGAEAGVISEKMGEALARQEMIVTALRLLGNYGVPQAAELARMEALAPRPGSVQGLMGAVNRYRGMRTALGDQVESNMTSAGYVRARGRGAARAAPTREQRPLRVRAPDGRVGEMTREQFNQARAAGIEVEEL